MAEQQKTIIIGGITSDGILLNEKEWKDRQKKQKLAQEKELEELARANNVLIY